MKETICIILWFIFVIGLGISVIWGILHRGPDSNVIVLIPCVICLIGAILSSAGISGVQTEHIL